MRPPHQLAIPPRPQSPPPPAPNARADKPESNRRYAHATASPKNSRAMPPDVRKAFGLPARLPSRFWATPNLLGQSPKFIVSLSGSAEHFRTSGGRAAGVNH